MPDDIAKFNVIAAIFLLIGAIAMPFLCRKNWMLVLWLPLLMISSVLLCRIF